MTNPRDTVVPTVVKVLCTAAGLLLLGAYAAPSVQAQNGTNGFAIWKLMSLSGRVALGGEYRSLKEPFGMPSDRTENTAMLARGLLNLESSVLHPRFLTLRVGLEYAPSLQRFMYPYARNFTEVANLERIDLGATLLEKLPVTATGDLSYLHHLANRDYISDVELRGQAYGGTIAWRNEFAPVSISYRRENSRQEELQLGRLRSATTTDVQGHTRTSLMGSDRHELHAVLTDRTLASSTADPLRSRLTSIRLQSLLPFDSARHGIAFLEASVQRSRLSIDYDRILASEQVRYDLPADFKTTTTYRFTSYTQPSMVWHQHTIGASISHQLYESLRSEASVDWNRGDGSAFGETVRSASIGFQYAKRIPGGSLHIGYSHRWSGEDRVAVSQTSHVANEEHALADGRLVLLNQSSVVRSSLIITDVTRTITYQESLDYTLIERGPFLELRRQPGGGIPDGTTVFAHYDVEHNPSRDLIATGTNGNVDVVLFDRMITVYIGYTDQFLDTKGPEPLLAISGMRERRAGLRITFDFLQSGIEFDEMASGAVPYFARSMYLRGGWTPLPALTLTGSGTARDVVLTRESERQVFLDASVRAQYQSFYQSTISCEGVYSMRKGRQNDLTRRAVSVDVAVPFRRFRLSIGGQIYSQIYLSEASDGARANVKLEREF